MPTKKVTTTEKKKSVKKAAPKTAKVKVPAAAGKEKKPKVEKVAKVVPEAPQEKVEVEKIVKKEKLGKYFYAVGRRKTSVAQVRLFETENAGDGDFIVNGKKLKEYFPLLSLQNNLFAPLKTSGTQGKFKMTVLVRGGGVTGQVEAVRLGIARALVKYDETLKKSLKDLGLMTRDAREVERKKAGLKKARKAPQWAKR